MDSLESKVDTLTKEVAEIRGIVGSLGERMARLEGTVSQMSERLNHLEIRFEARLGQVQTWLMGIVGLIVTMWVTIILAILLK